MSWSGASQSKTGFGPAFYPINLNLVGRRVLVVGAGELALPRIMTLVEFGAQVEVVAPIVMAEIQDLHLTHGERVSIHRRSFGSEDEGRIQGREYLLVFACTNSEEENVRVGNLARAAGVLSHVCDNSELCDFVLPSVMKRGHLKIAVATDGLSPVVAQAMRGRIESSLGTEIDKYVLFLGFLREKLVELEADPQLGNPAVRRKLARQLAESEDILLAVQRESFEEAGRLVELTISEAREASRV